VAFDDEKGGRPPKYKTPEEMQGEIDKYFDKCVEDEDIVTISGLAYALGFSTEAFRCYEQKDEFLATVKKAKQRVEMEWEKYLMAGKGSGPIFWLKNNAGWRDKTERELSGPEGGPIEITGIDVRFIDPDES
jgi:hypothetical protein